MTYLLRFYRVLSVAVCAVSLSLTLGLLPLCLQAQTITTIAGNGSRSFSGDGGPATSAGIYSPGGVAVDQQGNVLIVDVGNNRVRKVAPDGIITTVAGTTLGSTGSFYGDGGPATSSPLYTPTDVAVDAQGNFYITVFNHLRIRKVDTRGIITTLAGNGYSGYSGDYGRAVKAVLSNPSSIAVDAQGNIYFIDGLRVRKIGTDGIITTVIGHGIRGFLGDGGLAINAYLYNPSDLAVDHQGNIYLSDDYRIRRVDTNGIIMTIAGSGPRDFSGDGGPAATAGVNGPGGLTVDKQGNLYFYDSGNARIRKISTDGIISTVAGNGTRGFSGDGGHPLEASISPNYLAMDTQGSLYFSDYNNNRVRKITAVSVPLEVTSFSLINAETDQPIKELTAGEEIVLAGLPSRTINIRANTNPGAVGSVVMNLSGQQSHSITETVPPYSLFKDSNGDYHTWRPAPGSYTLTATPYTGPNGTGTPGTPLTISFSVADQLEVVSFSLINAESQQPIQELTAGQTVDLASLSTRKLNIRANTRPATVGSVVMELSGEQTRTQTETDAPYALFGDQGGTYRSWMPAPGSYTLTATPYTQTSGSGTAGKSLTLNFQFTDSSPAARLTAESGFKPGSLRVYPNPFRETFTVGMQGRGTIGQPLSLYDLLGRLVWQGVVGEEEPRIGGQLGAGQYVLRVGTGSETQHYKVIKKP
ncbi:putative secreted protein (Por secretion system target) [Larkinella arboricola]|uniref:Putative secreted protein (Por secretion system target) n=1 Tax=Larkinella arboricola TaxID=643671 RepID=A0A327WMB0_LARAB|nr:T9SS type A sorting domain-containing protein [Larkinella arboricola]RAJ92647.1 putative secreted protein (Por secretion system target) [Larkinella arboricola]